jgi:hypothetical protein
VLFRSETILPEDLDLFLLTDSVEEAAEYLRRETFDRFELSRKKVISPVSVFFEEGISEKPPIPQN